jgi:hypothetical protein
MTVVEMCDTLRGEIALAADNNGVPHLISQLTSTLEVHCRANNITPVVFILGRTNPVYSLQLYFISILKFGHPLIQWYSTWGTRTPGGTRGHLKGYV